MRSELPLGALGADIGETAIGTAATSTSTITIISTGTTTRTPIGTSTGVRLARATDGNTTRNTAETHPMGTDRRPTSLAVRVPAEPVIAVVPEDLVVPAVRAALAVPENPVVLVARGDLVARAALVVPENPVVLVAPGDPVVRAALVGPESPVAPELAQAVAEPELGPVGAVPGLGHLHDQLGALRKTRSATAAHPRGQVPLLVAEEDLAAAVVEIMRAPAVTEAATVWAAAV